MKTMVESVSTSLDWSITCTQHSIWKRKRKKKKIKKGQTIDVWFTHSYPNIDIHLPWSTHTTCISTGTSLKFPYSEKSYNQAESKYSFYFMNLRLSLLVIYLAYFMLSGVVYIYQIIIITIYALVNHLPI